MKIELRKRLLNIKTFLFIFLIAVVVGLTILTLRARNNLSLPPETNPIFGNLPLPQLPQPLPETLPSSVTTNLTTQDLPTTIKVFQQEPISTTQEEVLDMAQQLAFQIQPEIIQNNFYLFQEQEKNMLISAKEGVLVFNQTLPDYLKSLDKELIESFARSLIKTIFQGEEWENVVLQTEYFIVVDPHEIIQTSQEQANTAKIQVFPTIEQKRIVSQYKQPIGNESFVSIHLDRTNNAINLKSSFLGINLTESGIYPTKPIEIVSKEVQGNQALTTLLVPEGKHYRNISQEEELFPKTANYTELEIVYYYDQNPAGFLHPMYLLTGTTQLKDKRKATIQAILPAVDPRFFQK